MIHVLHLVSPPWKDRIIGILPLSPGFGEAGDDGTGERAWTSDCFNSNSYCS